MLAQDFVMMMKDTPKAAGFSQPAEWAPHQSCWLAWPSHGDLWKEELLPAQKEFTALCKAIAQGEDLHILIPDDASEKAAKSALSGLSIRFHRIPFGDIWLRDTAPIFLTGPGSQVATVRFKFNGWGEKYVLDHDEQVSTEIAQAADGPEFSFPWILEGGSVDVDGEGTCLTSRQCLLNKNRNSKMSQTEVETGLCEALGVSKILWLNDGLMNDHTDGHIDTIARFVAPGVVVCMKAADPKTDPNHKILEEIAHDLESFTDAKGRKLKVVRITSPGKILNEDGKVMPASYVNFYIGNAAVVVPTYGTAYDEIAVKEIAALFPTRKTIGSLAISILNGGGAFHCITQQQPSGKL
jgi:agmatine deiminase